jgi:HSP20 family protein
MSALTKWVDPLWTNGWKPSIVEDFFGKDFDNYFNGMFRGMSIPSVNISQTADSFEIELAAPGLKKEDFKINVEDDVLTISSEKEEEKEEKKKKYTRREYSFSSFSRSFVLPKDINAEGVKAEYTEGVLKVKLPKVEVTPKKKAKEIAIS